MIKKERIWARVSRKQKISILIRSSAIGSNLREILDNVPYPDIFLSFTDAKEKKRIESKKSYFGVLSTICLCKWGPGILSPYASNYKRKIFNKNANLASEM